MEIIYDYITRNAHGKYSAAPIISHNTKSMGYISYSGKNCMIILNNLYKGSNDHIRLNRKFTLFEELKGNYE